MERNKLISSTKYIRMADIIMHEIYDENKVFELVTAIIFLLKSDDEHREILVQLVKTKVNARILRMIENMNNIYDILFRLIRVMKDTRLNLVRQSNANRRNQE